MNLTIASARSSPNITLPAPELIDDASAGTFQVHSLHRLGSELFDLEVDPEELNDLADDPAFADILAKFERDLRAIVDPEETDKQAKADQRRRLEELGGMASIVAAGGVTHTPPGEEGQRI